MLNLTGSNQGSVDQQLLQDREGFIPRARAASADNTLDKYKGKKDHFPESQRTNIRIQWLHTNNMALTKCTDNTIKLNRQTCSLAVRQSVFTNYTGVVPDVGSRLHTLDAKGI